MTDCKNCAKLREEVELLKGRAELLLFLSRSSNILLNDLTDCRGRDSISGTATKEETQGVSK